jgi:hypothetical protein
LRDMKKIKNIVMLSLLAVVFATSSCSDFLNINTDPNRVTGDNVTPALIFTQAENAVGQRQATRFIFLNNWMGYWSRSGTFIVEQEETTYKASNTFSETNWDQAYNILFDLNQVTTRALAANDSLLAGASMVLSVKLWQETVDQFGAIPYSQAFDYANYPQPIYDPAATIYADLLVKLDKAITYMNAVNPKLTSFANTDIIFCRGTASATNIALWIKFANTIKLRIFLHQADKPGGGFTPTAAQLAKMTTTDGGFLAAGQNVSVQPGYSNSALKQNPFYAAFGLTPAGAPATTNNKPNNYFYKTILGSGATDPRSSKFYLGTVAGTDYGALGGNATDPNKTIVGSEIYAGTATQDQFILPAYESLFFQAEAIARGWITGGDAAAQAKFESAITESFTYLGVASAATAATTYIGAVPTAQWANSGSGIPSKVRFIDFQKYIANCGIDALESWTDYRRGTLVLPAGYLSKNTNLSTLGITHLPYVMPYPQTEWTVNSTNIPSTPSVRNTETIFTQKLFWQP